MHLGENSGWGFSTSQGDVAEQNGIYRSTLSSMKIKVAMQFLIGLLVFDSQSVLLLNQKKQETNKYSFVVCLP